MEGGIEAASLSVSGEDFTDAASSAVVVVLDLPWMRAARGGVVREEGVLAAVSRGGRGFFSWVLILRERGGEC